jgi:hypothetical protein
MTNQNGQNELWTESDNDQCLQYLNDRRIMREVNNDGMQWPDVFESCEDGS